MASKLTKTKEITMPFCNIRDKQKLKYLVLEIERDGSYTLRPKGTKREGPAVVSGSFATEYYQKIMARAMLVRK